MKWSLLTGSDILTHASLSVMIMASNWSSGRSSFQRLMQLPLQQLAFGSITSEILSLLMSRFALLPFTSSNGLPWMVPW